MISRYTPDVMGNHWHDKSKWARVLKVELAVIAALSEDGIIPVEAADYIRKQADFNLDKINEYDKVYRHDVIAFLTSVGDSLDFEVFGL